MSDSLYPTEDANGNALSTEYGLCVFKNHQTICLQEMPEHVIRTRMRVYVWCVCLCNH